MPFVRKYFFQIYFPKGAIYERIVVQNIFAPCRTQMGVFDEYIRPRSCFVFFGVAKISVEFQSGIGKKKPKIAKVMSENTFLSQKPYFV